MSLKKQCELFFSNKVRVLLDQEQKPYYRAKDISRLFFGPSSRKRVIVKPQYKRKSSELGNKGAEFYLNAKGVRDFIGKCPFDNKDEIEEYFIDFCVLSKYQQDVSGLNIFSLLNIATEDICDYSEEMAREIQHKEIQRQNRKKNVVAVPKGEELKAPKAKKEKAPGVTKKKQPAPEVPKLFIPEKVDISQEKYFAILRTGLANVFDITVHTREELEDMESVQVLKTSKQDLNDVIDELIESMPENKEHMFHINGRLKIKPPVTDADIVEGVKRILKQRKEQKKSETTIITEE